MVHESFHQQLYLAEYPRLLDTLTRIVARLHAGQLPFVRLVALFGSLARLTPHIHSDTDLLVLYDTVPDWSHWDAWTTDLLRLIRALEDETVDEHYRWPIMPLPTNPTGDDLDPDFLAIVGQEGVLLYQRQDASIPPALRGLQSFAQWDARVRVLLEANHASGQSYPAGSQP